MLRITLHTSAERMRIELAGKLSGAWVPELEQCWKTAAPLIADRPCWVDLSQVEYVDSAGRYLLALMYACGARFTGSGCMTGDLIEAIKGTCPMSRMSA
jgi:ABC-type transporter Mla MlaB component